MAEYGPPLSCRAYLVAWTDTIQWIQFDATVAEAEDLLFTDYFYWEHSSTGSENIAAEEYHIPAHVQAHIDCECLLAAWFSSFPWYLGFRY